MADHAKPEGASLPLSLYLSSPHDCPYLPDKLATDVFTQVSSISAADYALLMDHGFRRSGRLIYRPVCTDCRECRPIRVPVASFRASRSQRRVTRRNQDVDMSIATPQPTDEKWRLYRDYLRYQHDGKMDGDRDD
ncbi:MAG: hypothetical protein KDA33_14880, partial [Phycisphaerales bacterium]|nr:hypothetical protein [Phycisphaerales bacterium]